MSRKPKHWTVVYAEELRDRAKLLHTYGDERGATIAELHATELETRAAAWDAEELEIDEAAQLSGYHPETLRRLKRDGSWSGRRADLPRHERGHNIDVTLPSETGGVRSIAAQIGQPSTPKSRRMG